MADRWSLPKEPGSPPRTRVEVLGNLALRSVLIRVLGVDSHTLTNLVALRHALAEEFLASNGGEDRPTPEYIADLERQLTELAENHSEEIKARECAKARDRLFGRYPGFVA